MSGRTIDARGAFGQGILVASTTPFDDRGDVDLGAAAGHARWLVERGMDGIILGGSLGEGSALSHDERIALLGAVGPEVPPDRALILAVGASSTRDAVALARRASQAGARGLLVLPPYVYRGDRAEVRAHLESVFRATDLPSMLYNNPIAYGVDVPPEDVLELAERCPTLLAVKESSGDVRRITALRALLGDRIEIAVGLDDAVLEGVDAGARGWVAGLANALPDETRALFLMARAGDRAVARALYEWFLPLLRLDTDPKFVQAIKLVEAEVGRGSARVRPPRRELEGAELSETLELVRERLGRRPRVGPTA